VTGSFPIWSDQRATSSQRTVTAGPLSSTMW